VPGGDHPRVRVPDEGLLEQLPAPRRRTRRRVRASEATRRPRLGVRERLLILDTWMRSKLPAKDFASLVGVSTHTLYKWKQRFSESGPAGLEDRQRGRRGSRLADSTKRAILLLKQAHPEWGQDRIHDVLVRTEGFGASPGAIGRLLEEEGYVVEDVPTRPHPPKVRRFERARPNQLWQTDLFTFVLKRANRRVHVVVFMDDHSRYVVGYGLHASSSGALVREVFETAIANYGAPQEVLTDNGTQYHTWRGKSAFTKLLERRGIRQIIARPRHPQTLGKVERFWGTLWRECVERAIFVGIDDARRRIGLFIDHYNFQRTHSGIAGLVPADRYFAAAPQVLETLRKRVDARAKELAQHGTPRKTFYLTGRVGDEAISLHAEGERVVLTKGDGSREEVDLTAPGRRVEAGESGEASLPDPIAVEGHPEDPAAMEQDGEELAPGASPLDEVLPDLVQGLGRSRVHAQEGAEDIDADEGSDEPVADPGADRGSTLPMTGIPALYGEDDPLAPAAEEVDPVDTAEPDLEPGEEA
jgi:transposase InsO family protein